MRFPRYENYKNTGIIFLGQVPTHWNVTDLKWQLERNDGGVWGEDPDGQDETIVLRSTEQTVDGRWRIEDPAVRKLTKAEKNFATLEQDDLIVTKSSGSSLHIGKTSIVNAEIALMGCCYSNFMQRIRTKPSFDAKLAWYILNSELARLQFGILSNSTTGLSNLNGTVIGDIVLAFPPRSEQEAIVNFLDRETAKIDALLYEQRRLIDLLREKRQAVISHAVTKGLDRTASEKPSGIEWLGNIPAHWETRTIAKASTKITNGYVGPTRDILVEAGIPYIQSTHIKGGHINFDESYFVTAEWSNAHSKSILAEEDVVIVQTGAGTGDVGLVSKNEVGYNCHALIIVRSDKSLLRGSFLSAVLQSAYGQQKLCSIETGAMHPHLNCGEVRFVEIPLPPLSEQAEIVAYIGGTAERLDALTTETQRTIDLLQERRGALISSAVTGKIDVRGLVSAEAEAA